MYRILYSDQLTVTISWCRSVRDCSAQAGSMSKRSPLEIALAARDAGGVRASIEGGADINLPFADNLTPLCRAAALGAQRILKLLLAAGATVDATPSRSDCPDGSVVATHVAETGFAALHWAARENRLACACQLLDAGATVDVRAADDVTPLMLACKNGHHEVAKLLRRAGADVEAKNTRGGTAMVVACVMGAVDTLRLLLDLGANADALTVAVDDSDELFYCRPLVTACRYNQPKCVNLLLAAGCSLETMSVALAELEAFPSFVACARLVSRAKERLEQRLDAAGGRETVVPGGAQAEARAVAEARAEAAMAALLADEVEEGGGKAKVRAKGGKAKGGKAGGGKGSSGVADGGQAAVVKMVARADGPGMPEAAVAGTGGSGRAARACHGGGRG